MKNNLLKLILIYLGLSLLVPAKAQTHEVGVHGGWIYGYAEGRDNTSTMTGGWTAGGYYRFSLNKWIGVESGLDYTRKKLIIGYDLWENSLSVPLNLVVFPKFRFSLFGGVYLANRLGITIIYKGYNPATGNERYYKLGKQPFWGYEAGVKWNMKYFRFVASCKQDLSSWMVNDETWRTRNPIKSFSLKLTAEIPLWRNRK